MNLRRVGIRPRSSRVMGRKSKISWRVSSNALRTLFLNSASSETSCLGLRSKSRSRISAWSTRFAIDWAGPSCISRAIRMRSSSMIWNTWREASRTCLPPAGAAGGGSAPYIRCRSASIWLAERRNWPWSFSSARRAASASYSNWARSTESCASRMLVKVVFTSPGENWRRLLSRCFSTTCDSSARSRRTSSEDSRSRAFCSAASSSDSTICRRAVTDWWIKRNGSKISSVAVALEALMWKTGQTKRGSLLAGAMISRRFREAWPRGRCCERSPWLHFRSGPSAGHFRFPGRDPGRAGRRRRPASACRGVGPGRDDVRPQSMPDAVLLRLPLRDLHDPRPRGGQKPHAGGRPGGALGDLRPLQPLADAGAEDGQRLRAGAQRYLPELRHDAGPLLTDLPAPSLQHRPRGPRAGDLRSLPAGPPSHLPGRDHRRLWPHPPLLPDTAPGGLPGLRVDPGPPHLLRGRRPAAGVSRLSGVRPPHPPADPVRLLSGS